MQQQQHHFDVGPYAETVTTIPSDGSGTQPRTQTTGHFIPAQDLFTEILTNKPLRISKAFYFFFFAAFGSLFPLMAVYFKQLGMNSVQTGVLIGIRPFIEIFSAPFWGSLADRFKKGKIMIMGSIVCWILFTCSLAYIRPPAAACVIFNASHYVMYTPYAKETDEWYEVAVVEKDSGLLPVTTAAPTLPPGMLDLSLPLVGQAIGSWSDAPFFPERIPQVRVKRAIEEKEGKKKKASIFDSIDPIHRNKPPPGHIIGKSPTSIDYVLNYNKEQHASYVSPAFSTIVYKWEGVQEVFFLLLLLVLLGEFFSAPAVTLADAATLSYLGENTDLYGRQRMFGSVGWAISMYFMGMALDRSTEFPDHPCGPHERERNYKTCFTYFAILMIIALLVASRFSFEYDVVPYDSHEDIQLNPFDASKTTAPRPIFNTAPPINPPPNLLDGNQKKFEFIDKWKSAVFAQRTRQLPQWMTVIRALAGVRYGSFLFVVWFMGLGMGLVFAFLFWHLQDLGGTPTLFGVASVINHVSEIVAYLYSLELIKELGHTRVLCMGLAGNICRFLLISWVDNPWWVLPFELVQGVTHATVWAASCSYITQATEPELRPSSQGVLHALHHGLGRGMGAIVGGYFINNFGTRVTFACYGLLSAVVLGLYIHVNYTRKKDGAKGWREDEERTEVVMDGGMGLAPHGVPSAPIAKSSSRSNLKSMDAPTAITSASGGAPQAAYYSDPTIQAQAQWGGYTSDKGWS